MFSGSARSMRGLAYVHAFFVGEEEVEKIKTWDTPVVWDGKVSEAFREFFRSGSAAAG